MPESALSELRALRSRCRVLNRYVVEDYERFFDRNLRLFFRLPSEPPRKPDAVSVTTTATALMALAPAEHLADVLCSDNKHGVTEAVLKQLKLLLDFKWSSADLP